MTALGPTQRYDLRSRQVTLAPERVARAGRGENRIVNSLPSDYDSDSNADAERWDGKLPGS